MSLHHPANKHAVMTTLTHTASALCGTEILDQELEFLKTTFIDSGYSYKQIRLAFELVNGTSRIGTKPNSVALIPCVQTSCNIRSIGLPPGKISTFLWPVKDDLIWRHLGCIILLLSVTRRTLVRVVIQLGSELKNIIIIYVLHSLKISQ